ncbi:MAG TPA: hypothetical protein VL175_05305 [Pirellulales bacterium]|nr:hypothetical protein [Pirellulales bacterium]
MMCRSLLAILALVCASNVSRAAEYRVEPIKEPPADVAADIAAQLAPQGLRVIEGAKKTICEIWPAKTWATKAGFQPSDTVVYPLEPGTLVGVLRFPRKGVDFRGQDIAGGVYTLRYATQPVDGNHVGTFPTRDFLLMVPSAGDQSLAAPAEKDLFTASAQSAGSNHPAIMPLVKPEGGDEPLHNLAEHDWTTLAIPGHDKQGGKLTLEVIVVGKAAE